MLRGLLLLVLLGGSLPDQERRLLARAWVLEVNTSPGIEGVGVQKIAQAFIQQYANGAN